MLARGWRELEGRRAEVHYFRRGTIRALALWCTTLTGHVLKAWRLHTAMAIEARYELLRARANQTALDGHRRRARARALFAILTSWHSYAASKASSRLKADETFAYRGQLRALEQWRYNAALYARIAMAMGLADANFGSRARRRAWALWTSKADEINRRTRALLVLLQRRAYTTRLLVLQAWRLLVHRSRNLLLLNLRVHTRLSAVGFAEWSAAARRLAQLEEEVSARQADKREERLLDALATWREWSALSGGRQRKLMRHVSASCAALASPFTCCTSTRAARSSRTWSPIVRRRVAQLCLHTWRSLVRQDRRKQKLADAHALIGSTSSTPAAGGDPRQSPPAAHPACSGGGGAHQRGELGRCGG